MYKNLIDQNGKNHTEKGIEAEKNGDKDEKAFYKLMNNPVKKIKNLRKKVDIRLVNNEKDCLKWT